MRTIYPEEFGMILEEIKENIEDSVNCLDIRPIESNYNTKGMMFGGTKSTDTEGTIVVGEDEGRVAVDVSMEDGRVVSFTLRGSDDREGMENIIKWIKTSYGKS